MPKFLQPFSRPLRSKFWNLQGLRLLPKRWHSDYEHRNRSINTAPSNRTMPKRVWQFSVNILFGILSLSLSGSLSDWTFPTLTSTPNVLNCKIAKLHIHIHTAPEPRAPPELACSNLCDKIDNPCSRTACKGCMLCKGTETHSLSKCHKCLQM